MKSLFEESLKDSWECNIYFLAQVEIPVGIILFLV